jgi:hypothetical protein
MSDPARGPGPTTIMRALEAWHEARQTLAASADIETDEGAIMAALDADPTALSPDQLLGRVCRALTVCLLRVDESEELAAIMHARQLRYVARAATLRTEAYQLMQIFEKRVFHAPEGTFSFRKGTDSALITDEGLIPDEYWEVVQVRKLDRAKLLEDLADGLVIEGAALSNGAPTLAFRRNRKAGEAEPVIADEQTTIATEA